MGANQSLSEVNYFIDLGVIVDILFFDVLFSVGYSLNDMRFDTLLGASGTPVYSDVLAGPYFTIGLEIFPWD